MPTRDALSIRAEGNSSDPGLGLIGRHFPVGTRAVGVGDEELRLAGSKGNR